MAGGEGDGPAARGRAADRRHLPYLASRWRLSAGELQRGPLIEQGAFGAGAALPRLWRVAAVLQGSSSTGSSSAAGAKPFLRCAARVDLRPGVMLSCGRNVGAVAVLHARSVRGQLDGDEGAAVAERIGRARTSSPCIRRRGETIAPPHPQTQWAVLLPNMLTQPSDTRGHPVVRNATRAEECRAVPPCPPAQVAIKQVAGLRADDGGAEAAAGRAGPGWRETAALASLEREVRPQPAGPRRGENPAGAGLGCVAALACPDPPCPASEAPGVLSAMSVAVRVWLVSGPRAPVPMRGQLARRPGPRSSVTQPPRVRPPSLPLTLP
jgi:hypothetical protein